MIIRLMKPEQTFTSTPGRKKTANLYFIHKLESTKMTERIVFKYTFNNNP